MFSRVAVFAIVCLLFVSSMHLFISTEVLAQTEPEVTLSLYQDTLEADIQPGMQGSVKTTGQVKCIPTGSDSDKLSIQVTLNILVDRGFPCSINPQQFTLDPESNPSEEFTVSFTLPKETTADEVYLFRVFGTAKYIPGAKTHNIPSVNGTISIKPYMRYTASSQGMEEAYPGEPVTLALSISNYGNYDEEFLIEVAETNIPDLEKWEFELSHQKINIQENGGVMVYASLEIPEAAKRGSYHIFLNITPGGKNGTVDTSSSQVTMYVTVVSKLRGDPDYRIFAMIFGAVLLAVIIVAVVYIRYRRK